MGNVSGVGIGEAEETATLGLTDTFELTDAFELTFELTATGGGEKLSLGRAVPPVGLDFHAGRAPRPVGVDVGVYMLS
jgi:hypothetical protein